MIDLNDFLVLRPKLVDFHIFLTRDIFEGVDLNHLMCIFMLPYLIVMKDLKTKPIISLKEVRYMIFL